MLRISYQSADAPDTVLTRIRRGALEWRESQLPPELSARGLTGVEVHGSGSRFELIASQSRGEHPLTPYRVVGEVRADGAGSVVEVRIGVFGFARAASLVCAVLAVIILVTRGSGAVIMLVLAAAAFALDQARNSRVTRTSDPIVAYKILLLERALETATTRAPTAG